MNMKEYLFYTGQTVHDFAKSLEMSSDYLRCIMRGAKPLSKKFACMIEIVTKGVVKHDEVFGPYTHPDIKLLEKANNSDPSQ